MISVVIPAYNEEKTIHKCLTALVAQKTTRHFEVIIVDNASTDDTAEAAKMFADKLPLKVISEKRKGRGVARRTGFEKATGTIIFSSDADTVVPTDWIENLASSLEKSDAVAVTGTCKIVDCSKVTNAIFNKGMPGFMHFYRFFIGHYWLSGFSFAIYKDSYEKSGGFSQTLTALEDIDLSFKVNKIGKIKMLEHTPVIFSGRRFQRGIIPGVFSYISPFLKYYLFKKKDISLADIR